MSEANLPDLIRDFYLERVSLLMRHEDVATTIPDYDINNAYQYIVAREQTHLMWLLHALLDLGAPERALGRGSGEDNVFHLAAAQGLCTLLTHYPGECINDV